MPQVVLPVPQVEFRQSNRQAARLSSTAPLQLMLVQSDERLNGPLGKVLHMRTRRMGLFPPPLSGFYSSIKKTQGA